MAAVVYLDHAASARPHPRLLQWMEEAMRAYPWNPHGGTCFSEECRRAILRAEEELLRLLQIPADGASVIWTSGVTEALNLAASASGVPGAGPGWMDPAGHPALRRPFAGCESRGIVAVSAVNSETGAIADLPALRRAYPGRLLAVDGAQALGKISVPWNEAQVDLLALSSRKIGGPASTGALIVRKGVELTPGILGGGQQHGMRSGTLDTAGILSFVHAAGEAEAIRLPEEIRIRGLAKRLWQGLLQMPQAVRLSPTSGSPWISLVAFPGYEGAVIARILARQYGILTSPASACTAEQGERSAAVQALGVPEQVAMGALRISFGMESTAEDVDALLRVLPKVLENY